MIAFELSHSFTYEMFISEPRYLSTAQSLAQHDAVKWTGFPQALNRFLSAELNPHLSSPSDSDDSIEHRVIAEVSSKILVFHSATSIFSHQAMLAVLGECKKKLFGPPHRGETALRGTTVSSSRQTQPSLVFEGFTLAGSNYSFRSKMPDTGSLAH